jgi:hypothetical protein
LERIWFLQICYCEWDTDITDASYNFFVGLVELVPRHDRLEGISYQAHERIGIFLLLLSSILLLRHNGHPGIVRHDCMCEGVVFKYGSRVEAEVMMSQGMVAM